MQEHFTISPNIRKFVSSQPPVLADNQTSKPNTINNLLEANQELQYFSTQTAGKRFFYDLFKRGMDISVSTAMILVLSPLIVFIILMIKITSPGPIIFKHRRIGKHRQEFDCWKFRTMVTNADEILKTNPELRKQFDEKFKIDNDPRITKCGKFLRSSSLDELPQLVQVLQGKMSLIGPRPIIRRELEKYSIYSDKLLSVKPGLSGLWQTSGRSETTYAERVLLDMQYIEKRGAILDTKLLFKTVKTVVERSGAC